MSCVRLALLLCVCVVFSACGEDAAEKSAPVSAKSPVTDSAVTEAAPADEAVALDSGDVSVQILPESPTVASCLRAVIKGVPGRSAIVWSVNGTTVSSGTGAQLCGDNFKSGDQVSVSIGTTDNGAQDSVTIVNSPPQVVDISSTPDEIFAGRDVSVTPVAKDADGDEVTFTYQWVINGDEDATLSEATLPGDRFTKGDTIKVLIVPNDFYDDGPTYESYEQLVPNAAPQVTSQPPQGITSIDYRYQVKVSDPDDSQFTYRLDEAPIGMIIDSASGLIQWSLAGVEPGDYTIAIVVTDPEGAEGAQEYKLSLGAPQ